MSEVKKTLRCLTKVAEDNIRGMGRWIAEAIEPFVLSDCEKAAKTGCRCFVAHISRYTVGMDFMGFSRVAVLEAIAAALAQRLRDHSLKAELGQLSEPGINIYW